MPKIQESTGRYFLTIPKEIMIRKGWKKGDRLILTFNERGNVELYEVEEVGKEEIKEKI